MSAQFMVRNDCQRCFWAQEVEGDIILLVVQVMVGLAEEFF